MAQLIKLRDYISRYELDIYRYPSQFIRLKREKWDKLYQTWQGGIDDIHIEDAPEESKSKSLLSKFKLFNRKEKEPEPIKPINKLPESESDLRVHFLEQLYPFQLKWATSSLSYVSYMDQKYTYDRQLKYFLQRFPDNYLIMYYPIFNIKKAPVDGEIILISPVDIDIIYLLDDYSDTNIIISDERTWTIEKGGQQSKIISPVHSLKRTEQVIKSILNQKELTYNVRKTVLTQKNNIVLNQAPYNIDVIGKFEYEKWFNSKRELTSPLKSHQLKIANQLLDFCTTSSVKRPEWVEEKDEFRTVGEE